MVPDTRGIIERIKILNRHANRVAKSLGEYEKLLTDRVENAYLLQKKINQIEKMSSALSDPDIRRALGEWLSGERTAIEKAIDDFRFQLGQRLKAMLQNDGVKLRGQYPVLRFGMFTLRLNFEFGEAAFYFGPEVEKIKSRISLHPKTIYDTFKEYDSGMRIDPANLKAAYEELLDAYGRCIKIAGMLHGEKVLISEVLREYVFLKQSRQFWNDARRENFREFPRVKLSCMLYQLRALKIAEQHMRLHVATFDATTDKSRSFWVPDNEEGDGTHYEYISFEEMAE